MQRHLWRKLVGILLALGVTTASQAQCRFLPNHKLAEVTYRFSAEATPYGLTLHVTLETQTEPNGKLVVGLPGAWSGPRSTALQNLHAITPGVTITNGEEGGTKVVNASPGHPFVIGYDLVKDWTGPLVNPKQFHPVLLPEYMEITGSNALVSPQLAGADHGVTNFDWQMMPADWVLATSFGASAPADGLKARCQTVTGLWQAVHQGVYAAGDYRLHRFLIHGQPTVLAIRGKWSFTDEEAIGDLEKTIGTIRSFWHDDHFPYFLVTVKPFDRDKGSWDGSAYTHAFWMYIARQESIEGMLPTLAHESFHEWNPLRMGSMTSEADHETEWFHEGFTDYYASLLLLRGGILTPAKYVAALNQPLRAYPASSNAYVRGRIIALWLDGAIRRDTAGKHSLDDVMFDLVRDKAEPLDSGRIYRTVARYTTPEDQKILLRAVADHADLEPPAAIPSAGDCWRPERKEFPIYDLGFDLHGSKPEMTVKGVTDEGPAYAAGLRNGQKLKGYSVVNDPDRMAKITIGGDAGTKSVEYYPRGKAVAAWQYQQSSDPACAQASAPAH